VYRQGELVVVPVPFTDLSAIKRRPVLIISSNEYNLFRDDIIVVAVTSNLTQTGISLTSSDLVQGDLPKPSVIRSDKIYTLNQDIVVKRVGSVTDEVMHTVRAEIVKLIGRD